MRPKTHKVRLEEEPCCSGRCGRHPCPVLWHSNSNDSRPDKKRSQFPDATPSLLALSRELEDTSKDVEPVESVSSSRQGICRIARCGKGLLNGPCGGQAKGKCEVGGWKNDCAWVLIYNNLRDSGRLESLQEIQTSERLLPNGCCKGSDLQVREAFSELTRAIQTGNFVYTGEIEPVNTMSLEETLATAKILKGHVIAANVTDNPTAFAYMNALIPSYVIQKEVGLEAVYQVTVRDRNRLAITADLLAAGALGIKNVLALSGDHTTVGDDPRTKPVYDLDSTALVELLGKMVDEGPILRGTRLATRRSSTLELRETLMQIQLSQRY